MYFNKLFDFVWTLKIQILPIIQPQQRTCIVLVVWSESTTVIRGALNSLSSLAPFKGSNNAFFCYLDKQPLAVSRALPGYLPLKRRTSSLVDVYPSKSYQAQVWVLQPAASNFTSVHHLTKRPRRYYFSSFPKKKRSKFSSAWLGPSIARYGRHRNLVEDPCSMDQHRRTAQCPKAAGLGHTGSSRI
jgi:hypothetical protein